MEKEKEGVEGRGWNCRGKCWGWRGNIVLNRKIGILINTRGLSIKGRRKRAHGQGVEGGADGGTMTRSVRFILRASSTLALMSSLTRPTRGRISSVGIDYIVMKILTFDVLQLMTPFSTRFIE